jgi:hypothetical protein
MNVRVDLEAVRRCSERNEQLDVVTRTRTERPRWPREGQPLLWTEWRARCLYQAVSGSVRPDGRDATRALCSQLASGLSGSRSLTFRWVELLNHTDCGQSQSQSYFAIDSLSISMSWCRAHTGTCDQMFCSFGRYVFEYCCPVYCWAPLWREVGSVICQSKSVVVCQVKTHIYIFF